MRTPNFLIIGAMKSATTSLYSYLSQHPDIFMTKIKEPMFFNNLHQDNKYKIKGSISKKISTWEEYANLFNNVTSEIAIGEASPAYLYNNKCASLIHSYLPNVKIIAVLLHPTDRAYSNFLHTRRSDRETISDFYEALEEEEKRINNNWSPLYHYINQGYYYRQLKRYYNNFPKENIKVVLFDDLIKDPISTLEDIFTFLDVNKDVDIDTSKKSNSSGVPFGPAGWLLKKIRKYNLMPNIILSNYLSGSIINKLFSLVYKKPPRLDSFRRKKVTKKYFNSDILKLEKLINRDLSHWLD